MIKFGTDGWRGVIADDFTFDNVALVSQAIASYMAESGHGQAGVLVSYDARFLGPEFARLAATVTKANGIPTVMVSRPTPTPVTAYAIRERGLGGAIMFTASHNPPAYNGIKFIPHYAGPAEAPVTSAIERQIKQLGAKGALRPAAARDGWETADPSPAYLKHLLTLVDGDLIRRRRLKLVLDPLFGAAVGLLDLPFRELDCQVATIHNQFDALFGGRSPDPGAETLRPLSELVTESRSQAGLAVDGDGDRFGLVDEHGAYLSANQALGLLTEYLLEDRGERGAVVRSVATTHILDAIAQAHDCPLVEVPVGFKWIGAVMRERPVVIGGEESGGLSIGRHVPEKDGILACLLVVEMLARRQKPLADLLNGLYAKYGRFHSERLDFRVPAEKKAALLEYLTAHPPEAIAGVRVASAATDKADNGIKLVLANGDWLLARPSGTEPLVRVYIESTSERRFGELRDYAERLVG